MQGHYSGTRGTMRLTTADSWQNIVRKTCLTFRDMMQKLLAVLWLAITLLVAACGGGQASEPSAASRAGGDSAASTETETITAGDATTFLGRPASGIDPETGLPINPEEVNPGDRFIIIGTITSMNLTPTTSPEFVIQSPAGKRYRIRSQDLAETYFEDGAQLRLFEYQLGLKAMATAELAADAGPSDLAITTDLTLLYDEEG